VALLHQRALVPVGLAHCSVRKTSVTTTATALTKAADRSKV